MIAPAEVEKNIVQYLELYDKYHRLALEWWDAAYRDSFEREKVLFQIP